LSSNLEPSLIAVLSDINMPGMDGLQLLAACDDGRSLWRRRAAPPGQRVGATEFLSKPVDFDLLKETTAPAPRHGAGTTPPD